MRGKSSKLVALAVTLLLVFGLVGPGIGSIGAASVTEEEIVGSHDPVKSGYTDYKIENNANGTYSDGTLEVTITGWNDTHFDWESNIPVKYVYVKGGNAGSGDAKVFGILYTYDPAAMSGSELHALAHGDGFHGISHITFYYEEFVATYELSAAATGTYSFAETGEYDWTIEKAADQGEPGDPAITLEPGETETINYTLTATRSGPTLSEEKLLVSGTVTVENEGNMPLTGAEVKARPVWTADSSEVSGVEETLATGVSLAVGGSATYDFAWTIDKPDGASDYRVAAAVTADNGASDSAEAACTAGSGPATVYLDAAASVTDVITGIPGFVITSGFTGTWDIAEADLVNNVATKVYTVSVTNINAASDSDVDLDNTVTLVESDADHVDDWSVPFYTGESGGVTASISGYKFNDSNGDGVKGEGEGYLSGWSFELRRAPELNMLNSLGTPITVENGAGGWFSFDNLPPGTYYVSEVQQDGWQQTYPANDGYYTVHIDGQGNATVEGENANLCIFGNRQEQIIPGDPEGSFSCSLTDPAASEVLIEYGWSITKEVKPTTTVTIRKGNSYDFKYKVVATYGEEIAEDADLTGAVYVENDEESDSNLTITGITVQVQWDDDGVYEDLTSEIPVEFGADDELDPGGWDEYPYATSFAPVAGVTEYRVLARVTGYFADPEDEFTETATEEFELEFTYGDQEYKPYAAITDTYAAPDGFAVSLKSGDGAPWFVNGSATFEYALTLTNLSVRRGNSRQMRNTVDLYALSEPFDGQGEFRPEGEPDCSDDALVRISTGSRTSTERDPDPKLDPDPDPKPDPEPEPDDDEIEEPTEVYPDLPPVKPPVEPPVVEEPKPTVPSLPKTGGNAAAFIVSGLALASLGLAIRRRR